MLSSRDPSTYTGVDLGDQGIIFHSQANQDQFPDNVMSDFRCKLTKRLNLPGAWNIALHSLEYNSNIINVVDGEEDAEEVNRFYMQCCPASSLTMSLTAFAGEYNNNWWSLKKRIDFDINIPPLTEDVTSANQQVVDQLNEHFANTQFPLNQALMPANTSRFYLKMNLYSDPQEGDDDANSVAFTSKEMKYGVLRGRNLIDHILTLLNSAAGVGEYFNPTRGQRQYRFDFDENLNKITLLLSKHGKVKLDTGVDQCGSPQMINLLGLQSRYSDMANLNENDDPVTHVFHNHPDLRAVDHCHHTAEEGAGDEERKKQFRISQEKPYRPSTLAVGGDADQDLLYPFVHFTHFEPNSSVVKKVCLLNSSEFCKHTSLESLVAFCFPFHTMSLTDDDHIQLLSIEPGNNRTTIKSSGESFVVNSLGCPAAVGTSFTTTQDEAYRFAKPVDRELLKTILTETMPLNQIMRAGLSQGNAAEPTINVSLLSAPGQEADDVYTTMRHVTGFSSYCFTVEAATGHGRWFQPLLGSVVTLGCECLIPVEDFTTRYMFRKKLKKWSLDAMRDTFPNHPPVSNTVPFSTNRERARQVFDSAHSIHITQNKIRLKMGFVRRSDTGHVEFVYDQTKALSAPGSYREFRILSNEISELFREQPLYGEQTISLDDVLGMRIQEGVFQVQFRLKSHRPGDPANQLRINYVEMHFSPHLARMIGLLPATSKDLHEVGRIRVSNMKGLVETNDTSAYPLVGLGPRITHQPVREAIEGNVLRVHTAPHRVNCDLGITDMYIYLPLTIEKMSVGKSTASLLATVPISRRPNARIHYKVINPQKRKLLQEVLDEVQVQTLDYSGKRIKFAGSINGLTLDNRLQKWL